MIWIVIYLNIYPQILKLHNDCLFMYVYFSIPGNHHISGQILASNNADDLVSKICDDHMTQAKGTEFSENAGVGSTLKNIV